METEKLSDFLLNVLIEELACVDYQSAEYELETKGWRYEEYFDLKKDDWVASKSVLKRYGIDYAAIKKYKASSGTDFMEVITGILHKKPKATNEELLEALNDYLQTGNL